MAPCTVAEYGVKPEWVPGGSAGKGACGQVWGGRGGARVRVQQVDGVQNKEQECMMKRTGAIQDWVR